MTGGWVAAVLLVAAVMLVIWLFNKLVRDRARVAAAWSDIDVQRKRRHDLLPKLTAAVQAYAKHEATTQEATAALRSAQAVQAKPANADAAASAETRVSSGIRGLYAVAEAYPDLKASANFLDLQTQISDVEHDLQFARRYYNGAVRNLNVRCASFPSNLVARAFGFSPAVFFEFEP